MGLGVVADRVAVFDLAHGGRAEVLEHAPDHEEGRLHVVALEHREQFGRVGAGAVVEREGDLPRARARGFTNGV